MYINSAGLSLSWKLMISNEINNNNKTRTDRIVFVRFCALPLNNFLPLNYDCCVIWWIWAVCVCVHCLYLFVCFFCVHVIQSNTIHSLHYCLHSTRCVCVHVFFFRLMFQTKSTGFQIGFCNSPINDWILSFFGLCLAAKLVDVLARASKRPQYSYDI